MIYVLATVECKPGRRESYLEVLRRNVPKVRAEKGCITYEPTVDLDSGIPMQRKVRQDVLTIVEAWENLEALHAHLKAPHMLAYREEAKDLIDRVTIQVLEPV